MDEYKAIYDALSEFYRVNEDLRNDLEHYSLKETGRTLTTNIELFAAQNANTEYFDRIMDELNDLNAEPHSISEMEIMYEIIDDFNLLEV